MKQRRLVNKMVEQTEREVRGMAKRALALRKLRRGYQTCTRARRQQRLWARESTLLDDLMIVAGRAI